MNANQIINGDAKEVLKTLESESVDCCITSPPYFGLRQYIKDGAPGKEFEIGLEQTPEEYTAKLVEVFMEVKRVLRAEGTCWLNLGDSYAANRTYQIPDSKHVDVGNSMAMKIPEGLKQKDLIGIPWRVAFALQADGWYLRQDIIWHKLNPMPESVKDRCTKAHEYLFLLSKSANYYFDNEAIKEPAAYAGCNRGISKNISPNGLSDFGGKIQYDDRNKRSVWTVNTRSYHEAHFATFPEKLVEPMILAGCPDGGIVLDCFAGAGTTALVALKLNRKFLAIELNPDYCKMGQERVNAELSQLRI